MVTDTDLTLEQVVGVVQCREYRVGMVGDIWNSEYYSSGALYRCANCFGSLERITGPRRSFPGPREVFYACTECGGPRVQEAELLRELQELTARRHEDPALFVRWRAQHLRALDSALAECRPVLEWGKDKRRWVRLGRELRQTRMGKRAAMEVGRSALDHMGMGLSMLIAERWSLSGERENGGHRSVSEVHEVEGALQKSLKVLLDMKGRISPKEMMRVFGGRGNYNAYLAEVHQLRLDFWDLLIDETPWSVPRLTQIPGKGEAMGQNWSQNPGRNPRLRGTLISLALDGDQVEVCPDKENGKWTRVVPAPDGSAGGT